MRGPALILIAVVAVFGVLVPFIKNLSFLDPVLLFAYAWIGVLFAVPVSAGSVSQQGLALGQIAAIAAYGWGISAILIGCGILTVNAINWHGRILAPSGLFLVSVLLMSATACFALTVLSSALARVRGPQSAKTTLRLVFLIVLLALAFTYRFAPLAWRLQMTRHFTTAALTTLAFEASAILAALGIGVLFGMRRLLLAR